MFIIVVIFMQPVFGEEQIKSNYKHATCAKRPRFQLDSIRIRISGEREMRLFPFLLKWFSLLSSTLVLHCPLHTTQEINLFKMGAHWRCTASSSAIVNHRYFCTVYTTHIYIKPNYVSDMRCIWSKEINCEQMLSPATDWPVLNWKFKVMQSGFRPMRIFDRFLI